MSSAKDSGLAFIETSNIDCPIELYNVWLKEAQVHGADGTKPVVFNLATASKYGDVSSRTVVLKELIDNCFVFQGNRNGKKFQHINENPKAVICFLWAYTKEEKKITRQIKIEGVTEKLSREQSEKYFNARPLFAKIRSIICQSGEEVEWSELKEKHDKLLQKVTEENIELKIPEYEVAYKVIPQYFDFYYAYDTSIADRIVFKSLGEGKWAHKRVAT